MRSRRKTRGKKRGKGAFGRHLRRARSGRRVHVIGIIDEHSRVVWAADLSVRVDARALAKSLVRAVRRAGHSPQYLKLDNDQCFHSALFRGVCDELGIELVYGRPYWAQGQGRIERWWKTLNEPMERVRHVKIHMLPLGEAQAVVEERRVFTTRSGRTRRSLARRRVRRRRRWRACERPSVLGCRSVTARRIRTSWTKW